MANAASLGDFLQVFGVSGVDQHPPETRNRPNLCPDCVNLGDVEGLVLQISELQLDLKLHTGLESPAHPIQLSQKKYSFPDIPPSHHPIIPSSHHHPHSRTPPNPWPDQGLWPCHDLQIFQVRLELPLRKEGRGRHLAELLLLGQGLREARQRPKFVDLQGQLDVSLTHGNKQWQAMASNGKQCTKEYEVVTVV